MTNREKKVLLTIHHIISTSKSDTMTAESVAAQVEQLTDIDAAYALRVIKEAGLVRKDVAPE